MLAINSINGVQPACQPLRDGYSVTKSDLLGEGSGRSAETGVSFRYLVRKDTFKLTLKFKGSSSEIAQVESLVSQFTQTVVFRFGGSYLTRTFYPSDRQIIDSGVFAELSVNLIEV